MKLNNSESERLHLMIDAACERDWAKFASLSDEPFPNEAAITETFFMVADQLADAPKLNVVAEVGRAPDGTRMIHSNIEVIRTPPSRFTAVVKSIPDDGNGKFGIWVFCPLPEW